MACLRATTPIVVEYIRLLMALLPSLWLISMPLWAQQKGPAGRLLYEDSGQEVARPYVREGLLWLHHMEYDAARKAFEMASLLDPGNITVYWGEGMLHFRPLWSQFDPARGRAVLYKLGVKPAARMDRAATGLERGFVAGLEALYGDDASEGNGIDRFIEVTDSLIRGPDYQEELAVMHAAALVGRRQADDNARALVLLERVLSENPGHPGALNVYVYACASPALAWRAVEAAGRLESLSAGSPKSQLHPAYIYLAQGRWAEAGVLCRRTWDGAGAGIRTVPGGPDNRFYHSLRLLQYSLLQQGLIQEADGLLREMLRNLQSSGGERYRFHLALMKAAQVAESGLWTDQIAIREVPVQGLGILVRNAELFVQGMHALAMGDLQRTEWLILQMTDQRTMAVNGLQPAADFYGSSPEPAAYFSAEQMLIASEVLELQLKGWKALKEGSREEGLGYMRSAVQLYAPLNLYLGLPAIVQCAHEAYALMLMETGNPSEALTQYELSLEKMPNRSSALHGKYRALLASGKTDQAAQVRKLLQSNWSRADQMMLDKLK